ncbi:DNA polymerase III subunit gamma/tau [Candidatus Peregrinibacteria bacterium]|jgi:DNA polymerase III subunit gamma/tau|nr:DNA polymerase III subunit gamma/tau [Candidatus Peregrinibacteria bacterium]MBT5823742.1 DNA polymerase III subunit gamma/tau [Candidatus Peregrinibacteria bacterium]
MSFALYRKYRPQSFEELVGQGPVRETLMQALKQRKMVHAYLFSGPRGTGKTSTARLIARAIQCEKLSEAGQPCEKCDVCKLNLAGDLIDLVEVDAASNRGIDEIRDLREKIRFAPTHANSKVYIIDEVHMLTKEAFNALLKSLEEPPENVYFILATTEIHKIPETILSRCQRYDFRRITEREIVDRLKHIASKENIAADLGALELLAKHADGGMRDAISLLEQFSTSEVTEELVRERLGLSHHQAGDELYGALGSCDTQKALAVVDSLHKDGYDLQQFTTGFLGLLRVKLHEAVAGEKRAIVPKLLQWVDLFDEAWIKLRRASIAQLPLEIAVIRATHGEATSAPVSDAAAPVGKNIVQPAQAKRQEGLMHLDAIRTQLPAIMKSIRNPAVRHSFESGNLKSQDKKMLTFVFPSKFHYDRVHNAEAIVQIETALKTVTGNDLKVVFELDEGIMNWETIEEKI